MTPSAKTAGGRRNRRWTRELIIEKILEWDARYGEPPCSADWNPSLARWRAQEWRAERYRDGDWPSTNAAKRPFDGSFDAAIRAAGLEPRRPGPKRAAGAVRPAVRSVAEGACVSDRLAGETPIREDQGRELADALDRAAQAEARAAALERELLVAEGRAERAESKTADARRRARRASEQAGRARRARERVRVTRRDSRTDVLERVEAVIADADARVRASDDQAQAAIRDAAEARSATADARRATAEARAAAVAAERRARELSALVGDGQRRLTAGELSTLRAGGPSGPAVLATALRKLAKARAAGDRGGLRAALGEVASAAVRWHDRL
jgi:hypothetical protein